MKDALRYVCFLGISLFPLSAAHGLTVRLQGASTGELPEIHYTVGGSSRLDIVLELANGTEVDSPPVVLWQLGLSVSGDATAVGDIVFESVSPPEGSLFGSEPGPETTSELPANELVVSDVDTSVEFSGVVIPTQSVAPIVTLSLLPSNDADGEFTLWSAALDPDDTDHSSYWSHPPDFESTPFDNPLTASQRIELAIIHVAGLQTLAGDFNKNQVVDAADYTVWRDGLGTTHSAEGYEVWKQHFGEVLTNGARAASVPEPASVWLLLIGLIFHVVSSGARIVVAGLFTAS